MRRLVFWETVRHLEQSKYQIFARICIADAYDATKYAQEHCDKKNVRIIPAMDKKCYLILVLQRNVFILWQMNPVAQKVIQ